MDTDGTQFYTYDQRDVDPFQIEGMQYVSRIVIVVVKTASHRGKVRFRLDVKKGDLQPVEKAGIETPVGIFHLVNDIVGTADLQCGRIGTCFDPELGKCAGNENESEEKEKNCFFHNSDFW